ncbi:hypothetical protein MAE02_31950 [Microvirga aerophila]|uniref:Uncharacterized protein n=1 Tax=Microvirga aerophila TaxID=670291 RepID=A0A512BU35_9HYPH|nr:hypothetical protein MAE02_31950 [Microvirga aerophila]
MAHEHASGLQSLETLRQDIRADARETAAQITEAPGPQHEFPHHGKSPAFTDEVEGMSRRAGVLILTPAPLLRSS